VPEEYSEQIWKSGFLCRLTAAGVQQTKAMSLYIENYGLGGGHKTLLCPMCEADRLLLKRGLIPPPGEHTYGS
jgi:hypothetical protein